MTIMEKDVTNFVIFVAQDVFPGIKLGNFKE
jgi:hypothetical protein